MRRTATHLAAAQRIAHVGSWEAELQDLDDFSQDPLWWSDETYRIFGYKPGAVKVTHELFGNAIVPEDRARVWAEVQGALREHKRYEVEHRILRPDGSERVVHEHAEVIFDPATGRPVRFIGTVQDITERKRAEELLKESARVIQDLYDNAPCGYHSLNADGVFIRINDTELKWLGYTREEVVGKMRLADLLTPAGLQVYNQTFPVLKERGWLTDIETAVIRKDGTVLPVLLNSTAIQDDKGNFVASRTTLFDITDRKRAEETLRASEASVRQVIEASPVPLFVDGTDGKIEYLNRKFIETFGYTHEELATRADWFARAYPNPEYRRVVARQWEDAVIQACADSKPIGPVETQVTCKDGSARAVEFVGAVVGHRLMVAARDLTEHKRAENAIRASLKEKTVLLKEVHHRVKNNLQIVISLLNLQAVRIKNPEALEAMQETANRVRSMALLHETLYLSESLARVNFGNYIGNICSHLFRSYGPKAAHVKLDLRLQDVATDLDQTVSCGLIINELVSNALKHAFPDGRPGTITVELQATPQGRVTLKVADDGVGLPPALDIQQSGTLGHQLVFMLAEKLHGTVEVVREHGTVFRIAFQKHGEEHL
ncbi:MAG: PAS domain S-box protein [Verrucomicrobia bacterium]|nr:PAS domain S-box protein [Verrucomicrobiota bacterium]